MSLLNIPCPHCSRASQIDSDRLPEQRAAYPCPHCEGQVVVDKRELLGGASVEVKTPHPEPQAAAGATAQAAGGPSPAAATPTTIAPKRRFAKLPPNATFPSGIVLGEDDATIGEFQTQLASVGSTLEHIGSAEEARELIINEHPELCIYVGRKVSAPPYAPMRALIGLPPSIRRKLYLVLVADNLKTLDGNAAFMYQVNMILARADFPELAAALHSGVDYHNRLYRPYLNAVESRGSL